VKERSVENIMRGIDVFDPPRYMTVNQALEQLLEIEDKRNEKVVERTSRCVGVARLGQASQMIVFGSVQDIINVNFGDPLHSLVLVGETHFMENEVLEFYKFNEASPILPLVESKPELEEDQNSDTEYGL
jgi:diphthine synthase